MRLQLILVSIIYVFQQRVQAENTAFVLSAPNRFIISFAWRILNVHVNA